MRFIKKLLIMLMFLTIFLTACKPTPKETIVVNKGDNTFEQKIQQSAEVEEVATLMTSQEWKEEIVIDDKLKVVVNGHITLPKTANLPVTKLIAKTFTQEEIDKLINYFSNGGQVQGNDNKLTKSECEEMIVILKQSLEKWKNYTSLSNEEKAIIENGMSAEDNIMQISEEIKSYENLYKTAPKSNIKSNIVLDINNIPDDKALIGEVNMGKQMPAKFILSKTSDSKECNVFSYSNYFSDFVDFMQISEEEQIELENKLALTKDDAVNIAKKVLEDLELKNYEVNLVNIKPQQIESGKSAYYDISFDNTINKVPIKTFMSATEFQGASATNQNNGYMPNINYERLFIQVDDSGVIGLKWEVPYAQIETINDNVKIIDFEKAKELFKSYIVTKNLFDSRMENTKNIIEINDIYLNLAMLREKDNPEIVLASPVWDFVGYQTTVYSDTEETITETVPKSFVTINAISEALVDRNNGY